MYGFLGQFYFRPAGTAILHRFNWTVALRADHRSLVRSAPPERWRSGSRFLVPWKEVPLLRNARFRPKRRSRMGPLLMQSGEVVLHRRADGPAPGDSLEGLEPFRRNIALFSFLGTGVRAWQSSSDPKGPRLLLGGAATWALSQPQPGEARPAGSCSCWSRADIEERAEGVRVVSEGGNPGRADCGRPNGSL